MSEREKPPCRDHHYQCKKQKSDAKGQSVFDEKTINRTKAPEGGRAS